MPSAIEYLRVFAVPGSKPLSGSLASARNRFLKRRSIAVSEKGPGGIAGTSCATRACVTGWRGGGGVGSCFPDLAGGASLKRASPQRTQRGGIEDPHTSHLPRWILLPGDTG